MRVRTADPRYITKSRLKGERGWTDYTIRRILGEPDKYACNPHYKNAAPMRLYLIKRVDEAEKSCYFTRHVPSAKQKLAAAKAVRTKTEKLVRWAESIWIGYNFPKHSELSGEPRHKVNYLRHECTTYDRALLGLYGETGKNVAYPIIKNRILARIAAAFPELKHEAELQMARCSVPLPMLGAGGKARQSHVLLDAY